MNCEKCGDKSSWEYAERVTMRGNYQARLCVPCCNAFHEYARALPIAIEERQLVEHGSDIINAAIASADVAALTKQMVPIRARLHELELEWYTTSKTWVATKKETPAAQLL